ncbi:MAG: tyrosine-type recombinase/integrase [Alphaproteobacteria bacterium]
MAKSNHKLSALSINKTNKQGRYSDGGGLYLQIAAGGSKSWLFRFNLNKKAYQMGLGSVSAVSLSVARQKAAACRALLDEGKNPIQARQEQQAKLLFEQASSISFNHCAEAYINAHQQAWSNAKHIAQWKSTIKQYASPVIGDLSIAAIDTPLICKILEPIWHNKTETATRLRQRLEKILDWASVKGYRQQENPARWKGHLDKILPAPAKIMNVEHRKALPYKDIPQFMQQLQAQQGIGAKAFILMILTACRTGEIIKTSWQEINLKEKLWVIPAKRMKAKKEHRIPLSEQALEILTMMQENRRNDWIFCNESLNKPISNGVFIAHLKRMGLKEQIDPHGFRSSFRDWAAEQTNYPREVAEQALAHSLKDKVEAAYRRGDLLEKRAALMQDWANYCMDKKDKE